MRWMVAVLLGACSYGFVGTIAKTAYGAGFTAPQLVGAQQLLAALGLWTMALLSSAKRPTLKEALLLLAAGTTTGMSGLCYYGALQRLDASIAIVMLFQFTWIGILLEALIQRRFPGRDKLVAVALLCLGTILAAGLLDGGAHRLSPVGVALGLLSGLAYALVLIVSGRVAPQASPWYRSALIVSGGALLVLAVNPPTFLVDGSFLGGLWFWGSANALFGSILPIGLFAVGVPKIGAEMATILGAAELPAAVFMSRVALKDPVSPLQWLGVAIILVAIAVPHWLGRSAPQKEALHAS